MVRGARVAHGGGDQRARRAGGPADGAGGKRAGLHRPPGGDPCPGGLSADVGHGVRGGERRGRHVLRSLFPRGRQRDAGAVRVPGRWADHPVLRRARLRDVRGGGHLRGGDALPDVFHLRPGEGGVFGAVQRPMDRGSRGGSGVVQDGRDCAVRVRHQPDAGDAGPAGAGERVHGGQHPVRTAERITLKEGGDPGWHGWGGGGEWMTDDGGRRGRGSANGQRPPTRNLDGRWALKQKKMCVAFGGFPMSAVG